MTTRSCLVSQICHGTHAGSLLLVTMLAEPSSSEADKKPTKTKNYERPVELNTCAPCSESRAATTGFGTPPTLRMLVYPKIRLMMLLYCTCLLPPFVVTFLDEQQSQQSPKQENEGQRQPQPPEVSSQTQRSSQQPLEVGLTVKKKVEAATGAGGLFCAWRLSIFVFVTCT